MLTVDGPPEQIRPWLTGWGLGRWGSAVCALRLREGRRDHAWPEVSWVEEAGVVRVGGASEEAVAVLQGLLGRDPRHEPGIVAVHDDLVVVDKPSGWVVHDAGTGVPDLSAWVGLAPAHRLDRETSGLVVYARVPEAVQLVREATHKAYLALVWGSTRTKGVVRRRLSDARRGRALTAVTRYRTVARLGSVSYVRARIETGRKHQIRRHLEGIGHPVVGDRRYRGRRRGTLPGAPERLWLHAGQLTLQDGRAFEACLPPELEEHLEMLRSS